MRLNHCGLGTKGLRRLLLSTGALLAVAVAAISFAPRATQAPTSLAAAPSFAPSDANTLRASFARLPMIFEANQGQTDGHVKFLARGSGYGLFLTQKEAVLTLQHAAFENGSVVRRAAVLRMGLRNANLNAQVEGTQELPGKSNYLIGNNPAKWHQNVPQFGRVRYASVYPGVDLVYYGNQGRLEYDFEVAPGADPSQVALKLEGADGIHLDASGNLVLATSAGDVMLHAPRVYQKVGAEERPVEGRFDLRATNEVGFAIGAYDRNQALIIDPVLSYSTYLGGSGDEACSLINGTGIPTPGCPAVAVDGAANIYLAGSTSSPDFPGLNTGVADGSLTGVANVFVAKLNATGAAISFSTYLGGTGTDTTAGIAVDSGFNVLITGTTTSGDFPTVNAFQSTPLAAGTHAFVLKLDSGGSILLYSTYLSGTGTDSASGIALDSKGKPYVIGTTNSTDFPTTTAIVPGMTLGTNRFFVSKIDPILSGISSLPYSSYFGGGNPVGGQAVGGGIAVDASNNIYITGGTNYVHAGTDPTTDFPILNAFQACLDDPTNVTPCPTPATADDAFVAKINPAAATSGGAQLLYSTYIGGTADDIGYAVAVDSGGNSYVTGSTESNDVVIATPTTVFQSANGGGTDAFLAKINNPTTGSVTQTYFTYLGGSGDDTGLDVIIDSTLQAARITGWTKSADFPIVNPGSLPTTFGGNQDAFVARIDTTAVTPTAVGHFSAFLGGSGIDAGTSIVADPQAATYVAGETASPNFPTVAPFQGGPSGTSDVFVSKLIPTVGLTVTEKASPSPVGVGNNVTFTYTVTNTNDFITGVTFTDVLPTTGATFVSASGGSSACSTPAGGPITCTLAKLNANATATFTVVLTPTLGPAQLSDAGTITVVGTTFVAVPDPPAKATVNDFAVDVAPLTKTTPAGVPATYTITVTPTGTFPEAVNLSVTSGLPTGGTSLFPNSDSSIPNLNNGPASRELVINTTARVTTTAGLWQKNGPLYVLWLPISGLAFLGLGGAASRRRKLFASLLLGGFLTLLVFQTGCGSSKSTSTTTGTPAGKYNITVTGTSGKATRTKTFELVVQ